MELSYSSFVVERARLSDMTSPRTLKPSKSGRLQAWPPLAPVNFNKPRVDRTQSLPAPPTITPKNNLVTRSQSNLISQDVSKILSASQRARSQSQTTIASVEKVIVDDMNRRHNDVMQSVTEKLDTLKRDMVSGD